ncbi:MAG: NAD(P)-dependent oxidoreductase [Fuerstiella sp.]
MSAEKDSGTVGLIGIGLLGTALAERLMEAGFSVWGYDRAAAAMHRFSEIGGQPVLRIRDVAIAASRIVLCLPDSDCVEEVVVRIIPALKAGTVLIDTTTGEPGRTRTLADRLATADIALLDASVLGSSEVTRSGDATLLVGGTPQDLNRSRPVLEAVSSKIHHVGPVGSGQEMKLVANLVLGLNRAALAEGLHFAKTLELNLNVVLEVLQSGAAWSRVMDVKGRKMIDEDFAPQARLSQHLKDVRLILQQAATAETSLPLSEVHRRLLEQVAAAGDGDLDNSAVIRAWNA